MPAIGAQLGTDRRTIWRILRRPPTLEVEGHMEIYREQRMRCWDRMVTEGLRAAGLRSVIVDRALRRAIKGNYDLLAKLSASGISFQNFVRDAAIAQDKVLLLSGEATTRTTSNRRIEIKSEEHITLSVADQRREVDEMLEMERQLREAGEGMTLGLTESASPADGIKDQP